MPNIGRIYYLQINQKLYIVFERPKNAIEDEELILFFESHLKTQKKSVYFNTYKKSAQSDWLCVWRTN